MSSADNLGPQQPASNAGTNAEAAKPNGTPWLRYVAMLTGILAGLGGYLTVRGASMSNDAIYRSNQAVLYQARASDAWNEYQADSIKARVVQTQIEASTNLPAGNKLAAEAKDFRDRQPAKKAEAQGLEKTRDDWLSGASRLLNEKSYLDFAGVAVQLGIALASVAGLTRRKEAFIAGVVAGAAGVAITAYVLIHHVLAK